MLYSRGFEMKVKVFFEPRMFFDKRIEKLDIEYKTLSQLIRRTTNNEDEILDICLTSTNVFGEHPKFDKIIGKKIRMTIEILN